MSIVLEAIAKSYEGLCVVDRVSLDISDGELFVLLGPSGSGKSTILRLIAGLAMLDSGKIVLHGRDVTASAPQERGTGFVFQNYSIFRHMSAAENIEFGLKIRKTAAAARAERREQLLDLVGMAGLGSRYADQLSGGQQQRVALARALAYEPNVLLLDEPFGALDVRTRSQLRRSLKEVQQKLRVTAILVTHDQEEAFELADRIGVLDRGRLLEVGSPEALYTKPRTLFAATFLGAGTVLVGRVNQGKACLGPLELPIPPETPHDDGAPVQVLFRPEQVRLSADRPPESELVFGQGTIVEQNFSGPLRRIRLRLPRLPGTRQISPAIPFGEEGMLIDSVIPSATRVESSTSWVAVEGWHVLEQGQTRLLVFADGEATDEMLPLARWMVERMNASATLLTVARSQEEVESVREEMAERQHQAGLDEALLRARIGDPVEQIYLEENEALYSFVMLAPRADDGAAADEGPRRSGSASRPRRLLSRLGTTVTRLLENPAVPVMVVKKERPAIRRMLICTAAGEPGKNDARVGGRLARHFGAAVTLLYVTGGSDSASPLARAHLEHAAATLESLDVPVETRVVAAKSPARGIIAEARSGDHDLVVIGNHGPQYRSIFGRDDVTLQVLVGTDRPVLIVPEHLLTN